MIRPRGVAASLAIAAALLASSCGSDDEPGARERKPATKAEAERPLRVEAAEGPRGTELIVYVVDGAVNVPRTAGGKRTVTLRCFDQARRVVVAKRHRWPFTDTDQGLVPAHVHQRVARTKAAEVSRCELGGTRGPLSGPLAAGGFE